MLASAFTRHVEFSQKLAKKILRYLARYKALGLNSTWNGSGTTDTVPNLGLSGLAIFTDAGFVGFNLKSQSGVLVLWGGTVVLWRSGRQSTTATSTSEAEPTAGSLGTQIGMGLQCLLADWGLATTLRLRWDNLSTLSIAHLGGTWRPRHYAVRAQAVRELLDLGLVTLECVPTGDRVADVLTKALPSQLVQSFIGQFFVKSQ